jgi:hypothetical protein
MGASSSAALVALGRREVGVMSVGVRPATPIIETCAVVGPVVVGMFRRLVELWSLWNRGGGTMRWTG